VEKSCMGSAMASNSHGLPTVILISATEWLQITDKPKMILLSKMLFMYNHKSNMLETSLQDHSVRQN